ncbi:MAG: 50S ribosomal protein L24 [Candidatus Omnitrophota bacterium]
MLRIKRNDMVFVLSGKDRGKQGKVLRIFREKNRAIVENINMVKKARRKTKQDDKGGIIEVEASIELSNLALACKQCNKASRFKVAVLKDRSKVRECTRCGGVV